MAEGLASLPRLVWTFVIAEYLLPCDLLSFRAANHQLQAFIHSLLPDLITAFHLRAQTLINSVPEETRTQGEIEYLLTEPIRQSIWLQPI